MIMNYGAPVWKYCALAWGCVGKLLCRERPLLWENRQRRWGKTTENRKQTEKRKEKTKHTEKGEEDSVVSKEKKTGWSWKEWVATYLCDAAGQFFNFGKCLLWCKTLCLRHTTHVNDPIGIIVKRADNDTLQLLSKKSPGRGNDETVGEVRKIRNGEANQIQGGQSWLTWLPLFVLEPLIQVLDSGWWSGRISSSSLRPSLLPSELTRANCYRKVRE